MTRYSSFFVTVVIAAAASMAMAQSAGDWPQWRGPTRNGIAAPGKPLPATYPNGLRPGWVSEDLPGGDAGGFGSVVVADGKAYVYVNQNLPSKWRMLTKGFVNGQGYSPEMPAELSKAVEEARMSDARKELKGAKDPKALPDWISAFVTKNITEGPKDAEGKPAYAKCVNAVRARLQGGPDAFDLDLLAKLQPLVDKKIDTHEQALDELKKLGLDDATAKKVVGRMMPEEREPHDYVYCLDAANGKLQWKTPLGADWFYFACSCTPAVVGGKCYVWNSEGIVYCLDAKSGEIAWKSEALGAKNFHHNRSSSPLVIGDKVIVPADKGLAAVETATGKVAWKDEKLPNQQCTASAYTAGGKTWALVNAANKLALVDPADGKTAWSIPCGGAGTPTVVGDDAAVCAGDALGVMGYKLSAEKGEKTWTAPNKDTHSAPLIVGQHAYVVGGAYQEPNKGRAMCIAIADGKVVWEQNLGPAQLSSPILVGDTILAVNGSELVLFKATPEKYTPVETFKLGIDKWSSPCFANGKLYVRTAKNVACYELAP